MENVNNVPYHHPVPAPNLAPGPVLGSVPLGLTLVAFSTATIVFLGRKIYQLGWNKFVQSQIIEVGKHSFTISVVMTGLVGGMLLLSGSAVINYYKLKDPIPGKAGLILVAATYISSITALILLSKKNPLLFTRITCIYGIGTNILGLGFGLFLIKRGLKD